MLIVCPQCDARYDIAEATVPEGGRSVRCARCRQQWAVFPPAPQLRGAVEETMADDPAWDDITVPAPKEEAVDMPHLLHGVPDGPTPAASPQTPPAPTAERTPKPTTAKKKRVRAQRDLRPVFRAVGVLAGVTALIAIVVLRTKIVETVPSTARLYALVGLQVNLRGLELEEVHTSRVQEQGEDILLIEGQIRNITRMRLDVPRLKLAIRDAQGQEVYGWTILPSEPSLGATDVMAFRSRLASPPEGASVLVRFAKSEDFLIKPKPGKTQPPPAEEKGHEQTAPTAELAPKAENDHANTKAAKGKTATAPETPTAHEAVEELGLKKE